MKLFYSIVFLLFVAGLTAQDDFFDTYSDLTFKVDDYVYYTADTFLVSTKTSQELEKCRIQLSEFRFAVDDGGMPQSSSKIVAPLEKGNDHLQFYTIKDSYGQLWRIVKSVVNDNPTLTMYFYQGEGKLPLVNYVMYSKKALTSAEVAEVVADYFSTQLDDFDKKQRFDVDKYDLMDDPVFSVFCKNVMTSLQAKRK